MGFPQEGKKNELNCKTYKPIEKKMKNQWNREKVLDSLTVVEK